MKIVHTGTGKAYQLYPDTQLDIERPNLFFNDYGEQTFPVDIPDTDLNRELIGYPDMPANRNRPQADISCTIQDGDYFMSCRQAILGAKRKEKITTSFYMNEGSFLANIKKISVAAIFGDETIPGIHTVQEGISWCWSLRDNSNENFTIFPVIVDLDGERRGVNIVALMDNKGVPNTSRSSQGYTHGFFNSFERKETVDGQNITLSPGYYISPFIRANYLLKRIFSYFGYTLVDNFFTNTEPFKSMVFINNTADTLVNGTILLSHLVPDCLCSTLLDVFRKKFCCEFVPDEISKTVQIEFFKDSIVKKSVTDLSPYLIGHTEVDFQEPRQLKLSSKTSLTEGSNFNSTSELEKKYPSAYYDTQTGKYMRRGYSYRTWIEIVSEGNIPYYAEEEGYDDYEVSVPDTQFCYSSYVYYVNPGGNGVSQLNVSAPYIGDGRMLNSIIKGVSSDTEESSGDESYLTNTSHDQSPILAFVKPGANYVTGTNHDIKNGYSLLYNGPIGIYEKFYRDFDNLLRNALHKVTASLLLTDHLKQSLPVHRKVSLKNVDYLVDVLKYAIGGKNTPVDTTLLTTQLLEPVSLSKNESDRLPENKQYRWEPTYSTQGLSVNEWKAAGYTENTEVSYPVIYPVPPTKAQYDAGGKYYERTIYYSSYNARRGTYTYWKGNSYLKVVPYE